MKKIFLLIAILSSILLANQQQIDFRTAMLYKGDISSNTAYNMQQKNSLLVDIRTKREFNELRAKNSINIPLFYEKKGQRVYNKNFITQINELVKNDLNREIILICRSGSRTKLGANLLAYNNFKNVYNVKYGFAYDWIKVQLPTEK